MSSTLPYDCVEALAERLQTKCPIPKTIRKAPSGVRTPSPAISGIAAFAVTASYTRRWYANTSRMRTTKTCRRACTNTSGAQFGSERKSHDLAARSFRQTGLDAAKRYAAQRASQDPQFTKMPATWLNGDCWLDEP